MILGRGELLHVPWFLHLLNGSGVLGVRLTAFTTFIQMNGTMMGTRCCSVGSGPWEATQKLEDLEVSLPDSGQCVSRGTDGPIPLYR